MYRALADATAGDPAWLDAETAEDVLLGLVQTFRERAAAIDAFGELVRLEAAPAGQASSADFEALRQAMEGLPEARSRLEDLVTTVSDADLEQRVLRQLQLRVDDPFV